MTQMSDRRSPVHALVAGCDLGTADQQRAALQDLALCDLGATPKLGLKGPGAESWLRGQQIEVPAGTYDVVYLSDGGLIARLGGADFVVEGGPVRRLEDELARAPADVYPVRREDATFVLLGARRHEVMARLCSLDLAGVKPDRLLLTRAAGVSCTLLPQEGRLRLWVDYTYAVSFFETLLECVLERGGRVVAPA